jgi:hypothetical protein
MVEVKSPHRFNVDALIMRAHAVFAPTSSSS